MPTNGSPTEARTPSQRDAEGRSRPQPPIYLGHGAPSLTVQRAIITALDDPGPILLSGRCGTGKRTVAEILHHYAGGELEDVVIDRPGRIGRVGAFAYLCPAEALSWGLQARLPMFAGASRLIIGTRLDPDGPEGRARLNPVLRRHCRIQIRLPTLAERVEDLELLAVSLLQRLPMQRPISGISEEAIDCLRAYEWPGNVTELEQVLAHALTCAVGPHLEDTDLPPRLQLHALAELPPSSPEQLFSLARAERKAIDRAMHHARGNKRRAARLLQIGKTTLYRKLAGIM